MQRKEPASASQAPTQAGAGRSAAHLRGGRPGGRGGPARLPGTPGALTASACPRPKPAGPALATAWVGRRAGATRAFPGRLCGPRNCTAGAPPAQRRTKAGEAATHPCRSGSRATRRRATRRSPERVARSPPPRRASMLPQPAAMLPGSRGARGSGGRPPGGAAAALGCGSGCGGGCGRCHRCGRTLRAGRDGARRKPRHSGRRAASR